MLKIEKIAEKMKKVVNLEGTYFGDNNGHIVKQIDICCVGNYTNNYLMVLVISEMLKNGELTLAYTDKATEKNMKYLEKLIKD